MVLLLFDFFFHPFVPDVLSLWHQEFDFYTLLLSVVYGGIIEEIMMRWGMMTLLVWLFWKVAARKKQVPPYAVFWTAILVSSLVFAVGHYSVTALETEITTPVLVRMVILNGFGGVVFGWLYWKKNLETAMAAHICTHLTMQAVLVISTILS
ncbi:CPBP family intramembrane glutamic endopeptidase [Alkalicoccus halolimnae]|uniref:CPBP family intramembrane glutamic endopeptidase n=1 Tax=Alkalicoccus halolimnae TaxID=1667239 RepID=A0AAJ8N176_9BACI|nr:CPBP family intramembrane glutamic endopeptidase [Alkalicoccus halolimnae]